jgi:hypothetical protein
VRAYRLSLVLTGQAGRLIGLPAWPGALFYFISKSIAYAVEKG